MASALPKFTLRLSPTTSEEACWQGPPAGGRGRPTGLAAAAHGARPGPEMRRSGTGAILNMLLPRLLAALVLRRGDLTKYDGCAIVNAANER